MIEYSPTKKKLQAWKEVCQHIHGHLRGDGKLFSLAMRWQLSSGFQARIGEHDPPFGHNRMTITTMVPVSLKQDLSFHVHPIKAKSPLKRHRHMINFEHPLFRGHSSDQELLRGILYSPEIKTLIKQIKLSELSLETREKFSILSLSHPGELKDPEELYLFVQMTEALVDKLLANDIIDPTPPSRHFI